MAPQINDNDDGRLHILADYGNWERRDHRYLLSAGAVLFKGFHRFELFFHFCPLKVAFSREDSLVAVAQGHRGKLAVIPLVTEGLQARIASGWVSYRYGVKEEAPVLGYSKEAKTPATFLTLVYPFLKDTDLTLAEEKALQRWKSLFKD